MSPREKTKLVEERPKIKDLQPPSPLHSTQIEMTLSCRGLFNFDNLFKSPYCVVYMKEFWQDKYHEIGRTDYTYSTLDPEWAEKVTISYNFETVQLIRFDVLDHEKHGSYELLGTYTVALSDLVAQKNRQFVGKLRGQMPHNTTYNYGKIIIVTEELTNCKQTVTIKCSAEKLVKVSLIRQNDPFLVIYRENNDDTYSVVAKTGVSRSKKPDWSEMKIRASSLCNGDFDRIIKIECMDQRVWKGPRLIGSCFTTLRKLIESSTNRIVLADANVDFVAGMLQIDYIHITEKVSFMDYIRSGTQIHYAVGIDFTASNGVHTDPDSFHYLNPQRLNGYEIALMAIGQIMQSYASAQLYPAFGFGAKIPPNGEVSHLFPLNGNPSYPFCRGIDEILKYYRESLTTVKLNGPTNFAPVINSTISLARNCQDGNHYYVLLILTDGIISDMYETKEAIIQASKLPISIVIIGVGDCTFEEMEELHSAGIWLSVDDNCYAKRDIVQFVPLANFLSESDERDKKRVRSQAALAREVLAEIPNQLISFMEMRN